MRNLIVISLIVIISYGQRSNADVEKIKEVQRHIRKVIVAVIDTGIDPAMMTSDSLCKSGHKDFTGIGLQDNHGHGTHISGIIDQYAKNFIIAKDGEGKDLEAKKLYEYCQIIIKYWDPRVVNQDNIKNTIKAIKWAIQQNVDIINYSSGGTIYSKEEHAVILAALNKGIKVVVAAGNERSDIDKRESHYYPAMYDKRIIIVGNLVDNSRKIATSSNYGKSVNSWEVGTNIMSRLPGKGFGHMTGTSQATAVKTGKLIRQILSTK